MLGRVRRVAPPLGSRAGASTFRRWRGLHVLPADRSVVRAELEGFSDRSTDLDRRSRRAQRRFRNRIFPTAGRAASRRGVNLKGVPNYPRTSRGRSLSCYQAKGGHGKTRTDGANAAESAHLHRDRAAVIIVIVTAIRGRIIPDGLVIAEFARTTLTPRPHNAEI